MKIDQNLLIAVIPCLFSTMYIFINYILSKEKFNSDIENNRFKLYKIIFFKIKFYKTDSKEFLNYLIELNNNLLSNNKDTNEYFLMDPNSKRYLFNAIAYQKKDTWLRKKLYQNNANLFKKNIEKELNKITKKLYYPNYEFKKKISFFFTLYVFIVNSVFI